MARLNFKGWVSQSKILWAAGILLVCAVALATGFSSVDVTGNITVGGTVDGRDLAADGVVVDAITTNGADNLGAAEVTQLQNIDGTTISTSQWGFLGVMDQNVRTTDNVTFGSIAGTLTTASQGNVTTLGELTGLDLNGIFEYVQQAPGTSPPAGRNFIYPKSDDNLYIKNSAGVEKRVGGGSGEGGVNILSDNNPDFEAGTTNWNNAGSGTFGTTTTGADVGNGLTSGDWDAAAASDALTSDQVTLPNRLDSKNCAAHIFYKGGDTNIKFQAIDGSSNILGEVDLVAATNYTKARVTFVCPTSGTGAVRLIASADAAQVFVDDAFFGENTEIGEVATAELYGTWVSAQTANCIWSTASASFGDFAADGDCPTPTVTGKVTAAGTLVPHADLDAAPGGKYVITAVLQTSNTHTSDTTDECRLTDDTTNSPIAGVVNQGSDPDHRHMTIVGTFEYTSSGDRTIKIQCRTSGGTLFVQSANVGEVGFTVLRYPSDAEKAVRPDIASWRIDANIGGGNLSLGTSDQASYVAPNNSSLTLTQNTGSAPVGISCSSTNENDVGDTTCSVGDEEAGIVFNLPRAGTVYCKSNFSYRGQAGSSGSVAPVFQLINTANNSQTPVLLGNTRVQVGAPSQTNDVAANPAIDGTFVFTSKGKKTIRLMYEQDVTATVSQNVIVADESATQGQRDIHITCKYDDQNQAAPLLVNSVVSTHSGVTAVEAAMLTCSATSSIDDEHGAWIDSIGNVSGGACSITLTTGVFSGNPHCQATPVFGDRVLAIESASSSTISVGCLLTGLDCTSFTFELNCLGPK